MPLNESGYQTSKLYRFRLLLFSGHVASNLTQDGDCGGCWNDIRGRLNCYGCSKEVLFSQWYYNYQSRVFLVLDSFIPLKDLYNLLVEETVASSFTKC